MCGRAFLHSVLVLMSFGAVLVFFAGVHYTQLTGAGPSGPLCVVFRVVLLLVGVGMWLGSIALWAWFCARHRSARQRDTQKMAQDAQCRLPRTTAEPGRGVPDAPAYTYGPGGGSDGAARSSDSSARVWGEPGNGEPQPQPQP